MFAGFQRVNNSFLISYGLSGLPFQFLPHCSLLRPTLLDETTDFGEFAFDCAFRLRERRTGFFLPGDGISTCPSFCIEENVLEVSQTHNRRVHGGHMME